MTGPVAVTISALALGRVRRYGLADMVRHQAATRRHRLKPCLQRVRRDLILMAETSQVRGNGAFGEVLVQDWQAAKPLKPSAIKPALGHP